MLLIFDCDGVVVDSMIMHNKIESEAYRKRGLPVIPEELSRRFAGIPLADVLITLQAEMGVTLSDESIEEIKREVRKAFAEQVNSPASTLQGMPGLREALEQLTSYSRCIASGSSIENIGHMLRRTQTYDLFAPYIYSSHMVPRAKPFPDLFLYAAQHMQHTPYECIVIEDGVAGVEAAKSAGMRVLGFVGGSHCDEEQAGRLTSAGAECTFSNMNELLRWV